jgi:hypothetical protein
MFHVEHQVHFVPLSPLLNKRALPHQHARPNPDLHSRLFHHLSGQSPSPGLPKLDVAPWKIVVAGLKIPTQEDRLAMEPEAAGDDLDGRRGVDWRGHVEPGTISTLGERAASFGAI